MILLRNFDNASRYFDYESKTEIEGASNSQIWGWYKYVGGRLSAIIVKENCLYLLYGDDEFQITNDHKVLVTQNNHSKKEFTLVCGDTKLTSFSYSVSSTELNVSPFEYIDDEDFNWGEFIKKIINDSERKGNFVGNIMEGR